MKRTFLCSRWLTASLLLTLITASGFRLIVDDPAYRTRIDQWHQERVTSLKSENGWLNLAGLFWLEAGKNSLGRGTNFAVSFPEAGARVDLGALYLEKGEVRFVPPKEAEVSANGKAVTAPITIFSSDDNSITLAHGSLRWFIIKRGDKYGVRLRDLNSPYLSEFHGIDRFPVDESWRVNAKLEVPSVPKTIPILDVLGMTSQQALAGTLVFERAGKTYRLDAVGDGPKLFILFGDLTNAHQTYGSGRFLYVDKPGADGTTVLDFNQAINPPCAFTPYATCPLPPKQNKLALSVTAGEKRYGDH
ncbi:DUF1684 domain-containing protein [Spirosoma oryzicola]|uniref:DUF1684 domain-containing protein n=1 Tax=Spirosoma oryzicola TaxID=2898794 RepID=UPI001E62330D|nr:DUF1684 domain-containing protein [Spirosoma oryzicola]UHG92116.1 DUF1684 domain-containing protein [Spirosoma oryzicola]